MARTVIMDGRRVVLSSDNLSRDYLRVPELPLLLVPLFWVSSFFGNSSDVAREEDNKERKERKP